jgi:DNA (cytosine-5)-methyltransferase 1
MTYTMGSLFAGIGGFDLGFERAGFKTSWQVEIDPYCTKVLAKNFPEAERFGDIRECGRHNLKPVDVICGGFPCQDVSQAGKRFGIDGERSGLWREMRRIIRDLQPKLALVENTPGLLDRGMGRVLGELAEDGFDAEWGVFPACAFGAPHTRERVLILAYGKGERERQLRRLECSEEGAPYRNLHWQEAEPRVCRVVDGIPNRVDRLTAIGNAVVPQVVEMIARRIKQALEAR